MCTAIKYLVLSAATVALCLYVALCGYERVGSMHRKSLTAACM